MSLKHRKRQILKRLLVANHALTWWHNITPVIFKKSYAEIWPIINIYYAPIYSPFTVYFITFLNSVLTAFRVVNYNHRPLIIAICYMHCSFIVDTTISPIIIAIP